LRFAQRPAFRLEPARYPKRGELTGSPPSQASRLRQSHSQQARRVRCGSFVIMALLHT